MFDDAHLSIPTGNAGTEWTGAAPLITPEPWMQDAACTQVDPDLFFPGQGDPEATERARAVCATCPVAAQCLAYAMRTRQRYGVWGGTSPQQRVQMRTEQAQAPQPVRLCSMPGCGRKHRARGYCAAHYMKVIAA